MQTDAVAKTLHSRPASYDLNAHDLQQLEESGISEEEARRQLELLRRGPRFAQLARACTVKDGILRLNNQEKQDAIERFTEAANTSRISKFIPASGAATRMFKTLETFAQDNESPMTRPVQQFLEGFSNLALAHTEAGRRFEKELRIEGPHKAIRQLLVGKQAIGQTPKGLLPFHRDGDGVPRTPFEDHCIEMADLLYGQPGPVPLHFTVADDHRTAFEQCARDKLPLLEQELGCQFHVTFSCQSPATNTLALDEHGSPFRVEGNLLLRPGGHGSLLNNLEAARGDIVLVKNIDNISRQPSAVSVLWQKILVGELVRLERLLAAWRHRIATQSIPGLLQECSELLIQLFGNAPQVTNLDTTSREQQRQALTQWLERPIRVCGMVPDDTYTGGGPFWVRQPDGALRRQIVESVEIDSNNIEQRDITASGTHFNPVIMACSLKCQVGIRHRLSEYCLADANFVTSRSLEGKPLTSLERPGLWNGAMAGWNTLFIEVDPGTFNPVKSIVDLLQEQHR